VISFTPVNKQAIVLFQTNISTHEITPINPIAINPTIIVTIIDTKIFVEFVDEKILVSALIMSFIYLI
jgi:hypothetical protein